MKQTLAAGWIGVTVLLGLAGCATPPPAPSSALPVDVYLDGKGTAMVLDEQVPLMELPRLLKRTHVPGARTIAVHVPDTRDKQTMSQLTAALVKAGYHRVTFIGVRKADASVR